jgi:Ca2+-binding EF-hand superfamily protein
MSAFLVAHDRDHAHGKAISAVLARKLEGHIVQSREELERRLDEAIGVTDAANRPSLRALRHALKEKLERVVDILRRMDTDGNGTIDRAEFKEGIFGILGARSNCAGPDAPPMTELIANALRQSSNRLLDLFREWDADGDGDISRKEFHKAMPALGLEAPKADVDKLFDEWGGGDGTITYKEMSKVLKSKTKLKSHAIVWTRHDIDALFDVFGKWAGEVGVEHRPASFVTAFFQNAERGDVAEDVIAVTGHPDTLAG